MNRLLIIILIVFLAVPVFAETEKVDGVSQPGKVLNMPWFTGTQTVGKVAGVTATTAATLTCNTTTPWAQQTTTDDYTINNDTVISQKIKITSSTTICQVKLYLYSGAEKDVHVEVWSDNLMAGTKYGSSSNTASLVNDSSWHEITFTFTTNPTVTGDVYIHLVGGDSANPRIAVNTGAKQYTAGYYAWKTTEKTYELWFKVYTMQ